MHVDVVAAGHTLEFEAAGFREALEVGEPDVGMAAGGDALQELPWTHDVTVAGTWSLTGTRPQPHQRWHEPWAVPHSGSQCSTTLT